MTSGDFSCVSSNSLNKGIVSHKDHNHVVFLRNEFLCVYWELNSGQIFFHIIHKNMGFLRVRSFVSSSEKFVNQGSTSKSNSSESTSQSNFGMSTSRFNFDQCNEFVLIQIRHRKILFASKLKNLQISTKNRKTLKWNRQTFGTPKIWPWWRNEF